MEIRRIAPFESIIPLCKTLHFTLWTAEKQ
jgi:hypothetical protein